MTAQGAATPEVLETPHTSLLTKKVRALKKKLTKIAALEEKIAANPTLELNADQESLLGSKVRIEWAIQDLDQLRVQFEELEAATPAAPLPTPPPPVSPKPEEPAVDLGAAVDTAVCRLLRLLHVVARGEGLPKALQFYGKALLGQTSLPEDDFDDALDQSCVESKLYLEASPKMVAEGISYAGLERIVDAHVASLRPPQSNNRY